MPEGDIRAPLVFDDDSPWTPEVVAELRRLWSGGATLKVIGDRLGFSKSAVGGKVHRLGLPARANPVDLTAKKSRDRLVEQHASSIVRVGSGLGHIRAGFSAPLSGGCKAITCDDFLERQRRGEPIYCGEKRKPGSSYCDLHDSRYHVSPGGAPT